jgi:TetR/AcrR family transcriptional regulator
MDIKSEQSMEEAILEVAERLFLEKGYALTSTTEIAKEVGCNQALVHYYFRTKDNLFNQIFENKFKLFFKKILELNHFGEMSFLDKLKNIIESHFDLLRENPRIPFLVMNELSRQPQNLQQLKEKLHIYPEQLFAQLSRELEQEIQAGRIRPISSIDLVITMLSLNVSLFLILPIGVNLLEHDETQKEVMLNHRRAENVRFILNSLRP